MKRAVDLSRQELERIVERLQQSLYLECSGGELVWDPDKSFKGADVCQDIAESLFEAGLVCEQEEPFTPVDFDAAREERLDALRQICELANEQRQMLVELCQEINARASHELLGDVEMLLKRLMCLTTAIAGQAATARIMEGALADEIAPP